MKTGNAVLAAFFWFLSFFFPIRMLVLIYEYELFAYIPFNLDAIGFSFYLFLLFFVIGFIFFVTGIEFRIKGNFFRRLLNLPPKYSSKCDDEDFL